MRSPETPRWPRHDRRFRLAVVTRHKGAAGMTLFEVMVSVAVLSIGALVAVASMTTTSQVDAAISDRAVALRAALAQMEKVKSFDYGSDFQDFIDHWTDPANATFTVDALAAPVAEFRDKPLGTTGGTNYTQSGGTGSTTYGSAPPQGQVVCDATDPNRVEIRIAVNWKGKAGNETLSIPMTFTGVVP